jgi:predicted esterase
MGFSRGGQTALYASLKRFHQAWDPEVAFAAYIPLYASCNTALIGDTDVSAVPIRMFHGMAHDMFRWRHAGPMSSGCGAPATTCG